MSPWAVPSFQHYFLVASQASSSEGRTAMASPSMATELSSSSVKHLVANLTLRTAMNDR
jgi:hypothetical protein